MTPQVKVVEYPCTDTSVIVGLTAAGKTKLPIIEKRSFLQIIISLDYRACGGEKYANSLIMERSLLGQGRRYTFK